MDDGLRSARGPVSLVFLPGEISISGFPGDTILDAALDNGVELAHECGGNCACTTCHVAIGSGEENLSPIEEPEEQRLETAANRTPASRLACQALLLGGAVSLKIVETE